MQENFWSKETGQSKALFLIIYIYWQANIERIRSQMNENNTYISRATKQSCKVCGHTVDFYKITNLLENSHITFLVTIQTRS